MSELRQDRTTGNWVIIAPHRGQRPHMHAPAERIPKRPRFDPKCPFCPGHEAQLPGIIAETPAQNASGWCVRVIPNKFPAVQGELASRAAVCAGYQVQPAYGMHEVIIESPWHDTEPTTMDMGELAAIVWVYRARSRALLEQEGIAAVILFRNYGPQSGASLVHPHAQIIALDFVPPRVAAMNEWAKRYHGKHNRCAMCDELASARESGERIVDENESFVALVPFAAERPFELWLVPKQHQASFTALDDNALSSLTVLLSRALRRLQIAIDDPAYNFVIDTAPKSELASPHWHWKLRIVPNIAIWGGFELGTNLPINPSNPEKDARLLRASLPQS